LGIGLGTLIIIIAVIFSIVWCLACRNSSKPEVYSLLGLLVPGVLILAFALTPKTNQAAATSPITDGNFIPHFIFMVLSVIGFLIPCLYLLLKDTFAYKKAKNVARSAFVMREEEEEEEEILVDQPVRSQLELESNAQTENMQAA
jgi:hypothetical protein